LKDEKEEKEKEEELWAEEDEDVKDMEKENLGCEGEMGPEVARSFLSLLSYMFILTLCFTFYPLHMFSNKHLFWFLPKMEQFQLLLRLQ